MGFGRGGGRRGFGGNRGGRGGGRGMQDQGPPSEVIELGYFTHCCEDDIVCNSTCDKVPYFNAPVFFENKEQIGKVDEIFGGIKDTSFSVKLNSDIKAASFKEGQKLFIDPAKLLPIERFLSNARPRGRGAGGNRGGRGNNYVLPNGRGGFRGSDRGRGGGFRGGDRGSFRGSRNNSFRGDYGGRSSFG
uniref:H/ACA ribonucleoprotein complex subunit n=1 Tax=Syphacia muris TaxID=451379 RepID=A0A0N5AG32_9BILA